LSPEGFGVAVPYNLLAYKPYFVECHVPFSIRRQEQVSIACTVYNYAETKHRCLFRISKAEDICTQAGIGQTTNPIRFDLAGKSTETIIIPVVPLKVGNLNMIVETVFYPIGVKDVLKVEIRVEETGINQETYLSAELDPGATNGPRFSQNLDSQFCDNLGISSHAEIESQPENTLGCCYSLQNYSDRCSQCLGPLYTLDECCDLGNLQPNKAWGPHCELCPSTQESHPSANVQQNLFRLELPRNYIPGTAKCWVSISGKYLQGTIAIDTEVISKVHTGSGCGEQNMNYNFSPNVAILKYLKGKGTLTRDEETILTARIRSTYQHQLKYLYNDGGFGGSAASDYPGSPTKTWLTAFVLKCFCAATDLIYIDERYFSGMQSFLLSRQNGRTGEFNGDYFQYTIGDRSVLTAYVTIGLLECCNQGSYMLSDDTRHGVCLAVDFMENQFDSGVFRDDHSRAIVLYALSLANCTCNVCTVRPGIIQALHDQMDIEIYNRISTIKFITV
jgi:hypothetical protein